MISRRWFNHYWQISFSWRIRTSNSLQKNHLNQYGITREEMNFTVVHGKKYYVKTQWLPPNFVLLTHHIQMFMGKIKLNLFSLPCQFSIMKVEEILTSGGHLDISLISVIFTMMKMMSQIQLYLSNPVKIPQ